MHHWGTLEQAPYMNKLNSAHATPVWCMSLPPACQLLAVTPCRLSSAHSQKQINTDTTSSDHDQHSSNYISCHYNPLYRQKYTRTYTYPPHIHTSAHVCEVQWARARADQLAQARLHNAMTSMNLYWYIPSQNDSSLQMIVVVLVLITGIQSI